ncbi:copper amine oxidase [Brevibacillus laterosporus]|uniref:copper amine oxidase n=1 Tax=Brevibacillus laterosporus TaxID=1465 RepID=UPI00264CE22B|nr:copper amine oxidase [Brevibacillus laterosporus]MDN9012132.1 copper amine oxidase [Brevibacillus laterosporus]MDO0943228.1 copper amine oxidase [Brevibacillus laterosporus]
MQKRGKCIWVLLLAGYLLPASVSLGGITAEASGLQSSTFANKETIQSSKKQIADQQTSDAVPTRVSAQTFPFYAALQNENTVLLWDASKQGSQPIPIATDGKVQIADWSANNEWIAYLQSPDPKSYSGPWYLWVSKADGSKKYQVDQREITGTPKWSPTENMLVYQAKENTNEEGIVARITSKGIERVQTIFKQNEVNEVSDYSWYPDGKSLAVSFPQTKTENLHINQVFLDGTSRTLYRQMTSTIAEGIYARDATGLVWSPNGAFLAYFEKPNSPSLSADGVPIKVLQIHSQKTFQIGVGLAYPEWLTWSKDSTRLAFINGVDRMATYGKNLRVWETLNKQVYNKGQTDKVDSLPAFGSKADAPLLFLRGQEAPWPTQMENRPLVPGQRIWQLDQADKAKAITAGSSATADSSYSLAPTGRQVAYVRLQTPANGSLFVKDLSTGKEHELLKGVTLSSGYYGSYLPSWIQIAWKRDA